VLNDVERVEEQAERKASKMSGEYMLCEAVLGGVQ
jgi:hypothetical protein